MSASDKKSVQVTTYLPKEVLDQLKHWMDENEQRSVSQAVSLIVEHFLKKDGRPLGNTDLAPRVDALEEENLPPLLARLEIQMQQVREALIAAGARSLALGVEEHLAENTSISSAQFTYTVKEASVGLSKTEIMRRLDISPITLKRQADALKMTEEKYKRQNNRMEVRDRRAPEIFPPRAEPATAAMTPPRSRLRDPMSQSSALKPTFTHPTAKGYLTCSRPIKKSF